MKAFSRKGLLSVCLLMVVAIVAGCSGNKNEGSQVTDKNQPATSETANIENAYKDKYDTPVTITTVWGVDPELKFKNGETIENNVATQWAKDTLGIEIRSLWSVTDTNGAFATKMRLAMSSGQEMPDVVTIGDAQLAQDLIDSGMFREVGSLFDQYASDAWKQAVEIDNHVWDTYIRNGEKMGIPVLDYAYNHDYLLWIRHDWLEKLGLEAPKTLDELEIVMEAFKNNNPDGLAPDEVVPLSIGFKNSWNSWMADPSWVFGAYGTIPQQWNVGTDGKLEYGSINSGSKQALQKINEWFTKGYIPKEAALWDENKASEPAVAGKAGIIPGPYWMSGWPLSDTVKNVEGAVWKPIAIPTGPDGKAGRHGTHFTNGVVLINKDMKNPEALFTYQNYMFNNLANPEVGSEFDNGLFKGYDYDVDASGKVLHLDDIPGGYVNSIRYLLVRDGARIPDAQMKALLNLANGQEAKTKLELEVKNNYGAETPAAAKVLLEQDSISMKNMFTGPTTTTMKSKMDYLNKIESQAFNEIIYGEKSVDSFDQFVETWKSSGGDQITQEVNDWYDTVK
ncbi:extracellular solute-binding protein [Paenibacillus crassostreae]|uniref:Sugar ABC transporter n=1 Tax=Paenibacillus crassostreae TaxID=1763538 RepID=A0A167AJ33_9BACL|nr:extracellular solute-binding protein [Paenibacillus crassostreae]AOZ92373.1 sugar ABC transporter [Paenibacillus crassostreae]OAB71088.1 sugar ABC transporter [Paenibacillus crassostreae]